MSDILSLFIEFFKIGLFTFGGGYAMLPIIEHEIVDRKGWITNEELLQYFSLSQCTPGVIAVNTATFVGTKRSGFWGGVSATLGVITPSIVIISIFATVLKELDEFAAVAHAFAGIRPAVAALIVVSCIKIFKSSVKSFSQILLCTVSFILVAFFKLSPIFVVLIASIYGLLFYRKGGENQ